MRKLDKKDMLIHGAFLFDGVGEKLHCPNCKDVILLHGHTETSNHVGYFCLRCNWLFSLEEVKHYGT